jgi:CO dehydrogenase nickel-insertion accessory protein CooC1
VIVCWSLKGGSGTTVVSAALALTLAQRNSAAVRIVDLAGDIPSALGIAEPSGEGVTNWLQQQQPSPIQSLQIPVTARVSLISIWCSTVSIVPPQLAHFQVRV